MRLSAFKIKDGVDARSAFPADFLRWIGAHMVVADGRNAPGGCVVAPVYGPRSSDQSDAIRRMVRMAGRLRREADPQPARSRRKRQP